MPESSARLVLLDEETAYEHVFERYTYLQKNANKLKQDLGIVSRSTSSVDLDFEPKDAKKCHRKERFSFEVSQSLSSLNSSKINDNSTTGYVVWSTTPFFLQWLLYSDTGLLFTNGGDLRCDEETPAKCCNVPAMFSDPSIEADNQPLRQIVELGCGVAGILGIALGNYVDKYVLTDQKALLDRLKHNVAHNIDELRLRGMDSTTLGFASPRKTPLKTQMDVLCLDWEKLDPRPANLHNLLKPDRRAIVTIISVDVVYNEYLIEPFLRIVQGLMRAYKELGHVSTALVGVQLRDQDIIQTFLECAIVDFKLRVYAILDADIEATRFGLYYMKLKE
ncbi:LAME_0G11364g1_1 [Lachancea meyersii CBS 8951]|uniref:Ribosomal lysine N-methyltransferase 5 n=1 Tax=Lachancea meyersii CBS 8951 TaxID=1266667 RepID=A0A1G4K9D4_9SACH|nr:LAME_0G11364g1_1 [Lachancea meyersii CBS 8951]